MRQRSLSLRTKFLLVIVSTALPLGLIGWWLATAAARSGDALLRARLEESLDRAAAQIGARWVARRSALLDFTETEALRSGLRRVVTREELEVDAATLSEVYAPLADWVDTAVVRDAAGTVRWSLPLRRTAAGANNERPAREPAITATFDIDEGGSGSRRRLGALEARLPVSDLVPPAAGWTAGAGSTLGVFDSGGDASLLPLPFTPELLARDSFVWEGERWIAIRRVLYEPPLRLVAAAPVTSYARPFEQAARRGLIVLVTVALVSLAVALLLTRRLTRSLERLALAATRVSRGDLDAASGPHGDDEVGRVAGAFDSMIASLRQTLARLAQRESLAAVGEFAAKLAHEVRNPLTSIRIDLQRLEEKLEDDPQMREPIARALRSILRLEATVSGALRVARSSQLNVERVDLLAPLDAAIADAEPELRAHGAVLDFVRRSAPLHAANPSAVWITGDRSALHQLFLNLLLNAAQAVEPGGRVGMWIEADVHDVLIRISDTGRGIPADVRDRVFEPFYSTKPSGTGLGLTIARHIAAAHGGSIDIEGEAGSGTKVIVRLPRAADPPHRNDLDRAT